MDDIWNEITTGSVLAFRTLIPTPEERIPLTWSNGIYPLLCYVPLVFMAYLARRPDTYPIRLLLLPTTVSAVIFAAYHFTWTQPELNVYNWAQCLMAAVVITKALQFALTKEGILKVGESRPGVFKGKSKPNGHVIDNGHLPPSTELEYPGYQNTFIPQWISDAFELLHTNRGLKFKFGQGVHVPSFTRPLDSIQSFLNATFKSFFINFLTLDLCESLIKLFPGTIGTPIGGTMFYPDLPAPFPRYLISTAIHMLTGIALLAGFGMVYDLTTLVGVGVFNNSPLSWPPVTDDPWSSRSLHELWARRWHQLLRQTFIIYGGYPGKWVMESIMNVISLPLVLFPSFNKPNPKSKSENKRRLFIREMGNLGMLLGAFVASGLFHECAMYAMNRGFDWVPVLFFAAQGPILIGERLWRKVTGRRVGGWIGRLWVYFVLFILAQPMVNSWHRRGLGGSMVIPPILSPVRIFLLPLIQKFIHLI